MGENFYQLDLPKRRRMLADQGFVRDETRVWRHFDGRAIGDGKPHAQPGYEGGIRQPGHHKVRHGQRMKRAGKKA